MGLIGVAAPAIVEEKVAKIILSDPNVTDIFKLHVLQEGRTYHIDSCIELLPGLSLAEADDIMFRLRTTLLDDPDITDVVLGVIEGDGIRNWIPNYQIN